jgi:hypothetical protein
VFPDAPREHREQQRREEPKSLELWEAMAPSRQRYANKAPFSGPPDSRVGADASLAEIAYDDHQPVLLVFCSVWQFLRPFLRCERLTLDCGPEYMLLP